MADKKISDFTATTSLAGGDLFEIENTGNNSRKITFDNIKAALSRGALVTMAADQAAANYSAGAAIAFDSEGYDTDAIHDTVTNNSRLTVPSGVTKVKLSGSCYLSNVTGGSDCFFWIQKNGVQAFLGAGNMVVDTSSTFPRMSISSAMLAVTAGDYFDLWLLCTDSSITVTKDLTWFAMEVIS